MRRALIVMIGLVLACAAVIVVIRMRVEGKIVLPSENPPAAVKGMPDSSAAPMPPVKKGMAKEGAAPMAGSEGEPPSAETVGPPDGFLWWGGDSIRKDARIPNWHRDYSKRWGYDVPVSYTSEGKLVVASKYGDHSSCIWCYDAAANEFSVLYPKTRWPVSFIEGDTVRDLSWSESSREYSWEFAQEMKRNVRIAKEWNRATLRGNRKGDASYRMRGATDDETTGLVFQTTVDKYPSIWSLNKGALELEMERYSTRVSVPFVNRTYLDREFASVKVRDAISRRVISSLTLGEEEYLFDVRDCGGGLALMFVRAPIDARHIDGAIVRYYLAMHVVLVRYPELRVIGCGPLLGPEPRVTGPVYLLRTGTDVAFQRMASLKDGLATDVVSYDAASNYVHKAKGEEAEDRTMPPSSGNPILCRIRVPQGWREAAGRVRQNLLCGTDTSGCLDLDISEAGVFDLEKWDAHWGSEVEGDPFPENLSHSYAWRDGVVFWRKRHTGEVVMAEATNLSRQVVVGGEGTVWDGFRLNPIRDEMVTWRENGELVFWNAQFPEATPLVQSRVITDETPHRLELTQQ